MENLVKQSRKGRGMTKVDLAEIVGCDEQTISDIENMKLLPSRQMMYSIALALQLKVDQIFYTEI